MPLTLSTAARAALALLSLVLSAQLFVPSLRSYQAHRLVREAKEAKLWGRLEVARERLYGAIMLTPLDAELYRVLGDLETLREQWRKEDAAEEGALAAYASATALNTLDGSLFASYAEALLRARKFTAAQEALREALNRDPNNAVYNTLQGRIAEAEGKVGEALWAYRRAEAIKPSRERQAQIEALSGH